MQTWLFNILDFHETCLNIVVSEKCKSQNPGLIKPLGSTAAAEPVNYLDWRCNATCLDICTCSFLFEVPAEWGAKALASRPTFDFNHAGGTNLASGCARALCVAEKTTRREKYECA